MNVKTALPLILFILCAITVSAAQESIGVFKEGECVTLKQSCASCSYITFTSVSLAEITPTLVATNLTGIASGTEYSYSLCNVTSLGRYIVNGVCDVDGIDTVFSYDFKVTQSGREESDSPVSLAVALVFIVLNVGLFMLYFKKEPFSESKYTNFMIKRSILIVAIFFTMFSISIIGSLVAASSFQLLDQMYFLMELVGWIGYISVFILIISSVFQLLGEMREDKKARRMGDEDDG